MALEVPLFEQNLHYSARLDRMIFSSCWDQGIASLADFEVTERGAGANRSVDVSAGYAHVDGTAFLNQFQYLVYNTATVNVPLDPVPVSNSRYDLIVITVRDDVMDSSGFNDAILTYVTGTAAAVPVLPAVPTSSLCIAVIGPISAATPSITNSMIARPSGVLRGLKLPPGTVLDHHSAAIPNGYELAYGQSKTLDSTTRALWLALGSPALSGGAFTVPDYRGRVAAGPDNMGGSDAGRITGSGNLGDTFGEQKHQMTASELFEHNHNMDHNHARANVTNDADFALFGVPGYGGTGIYGVMAGYTDSLTLKVPLGVDLPNLVQNTGTAGTTNTPFNVMQPTIFCNKIIRVR